MISQKRVSVGLMIAAIFLTGATMTLLISTDYCFYNKCTANNCSIKECSKGFYNNSTRR